MYLEDYARFAGTGEKNAAGKTLKEFLEAYNPKKYDCPCHTVDTAIFRRQGERGLRLLLIRRKNHPSIGFWALPGGFVDLKENLGDAAARELQEETGVTGVPLKQLATFGDYDRDPRWRVITTLFFTILKEEIPVRAGDDAADAEWFDADCGEEQTVGGQTLVRLRLSAGKDRPGLTASALLAVSGEGPLREEKLLPQTSDGLAADHGLLIMSAMRYIRSFEG